MPIEKVPVVHKFGIISHSQRLELQERILKQSYLDTLASRKGLSTRNPFEVTEDFVQEYNGAESIDQQERYEDVARKMLERIKRKAGLKEAGVGQHVDLPLAWTELSQLAQCKGQIQEDCLDVLITSLDQAPLHKSHIPALFFLAETALYWLRTDAINQPYLRTGELKLLRMGMLVFMRLFYHHMAGHLQKHEDFKTRLFTYLDGFADCQDAYSPYPNALLCIRFINEVGRMVIGDAPVEPGELKEGDATSNKSLTDSAVLSQSQAQSESPKEIVRSATTRSENVSEFFRDVAADYEQGSDCSQQSGAISSSVHDLSPTLWHSLDVWRCVNRTHKGLSDALSALSHCAMGLASESWVDGIVALQILADASKTNVKILRALQNLAKGVPPKPNPNDLNDDDTALGSASVHTRDKSHTSKTSKSSQMTSSKFGLSDIYEKTEYDSSHSKSHVRSGQTKMTNYSDDDPESVSPGYPTRTPTKSGRKSEGSPDKMSKTPGKTFGSSNHETLSPDKYLRSPDKMNTNTNIRSPDKSQRTTTYSRNKTNDTLRTSTSMSRLQTGESGWQAELNTEGASGGRLSQASSVPTYSNKVSIELPGLHGWHWEVAITYADMLADIVLHATTSGIQKVALVGNNRDDSTEQDRQNQVMNCPMQSAGLLDLIYFRAVDESDDGGPNDWSWRIRYAAIQGLVKICRCCAGDSTKEGMRTVAWNSLLRAHSLERDSRVLEALKVGQVDANIENLLAKHLAVLPSTIGAKTAAGLSHLYLPPVRSPVQVVLPKKRPAKHIQINKPVPRRPQRTTLKEEIQLATALYEPPVSFETKASYDLRRIVEDQWRKGLQIELDDEEEERKRQLEERQLDEEEIQKEKEESRMNKMKNRYKPKEYCDLPYTPTALTEGRTRASNTECSSISNFTLRHGLHAQ